MKSNEVYSKTMKFVWMKLALGLCLIVALALLGGIFFGIAAATGGGIFPVLMYLWIIIAVVAYGAVQHFIGYILKAGHVAAVTHIVTTGTVPADPFTYGTDMVKKRFATTAVYFAVDRLVTGAVRQINHGLDIIGNILGKIPGMDSLVSFAKSFVNIALGNVDECCLAYTFYQQEQPAFKSAADGVVIYFQNWKLILKSALKVTLLVFVITVLAAIVLMLVLVGALGTIGVPGFEAFAVGLIFAILIVGVVKSAFLDSYTMVSMVCTYMQAAPSTEITFDLYGKLCNLSSKFKSLFEKGQAEQPAEKQTIA